MYITVSSNKIEKGIKVGSKVCMRLLPKIGNENGVSFPKVELSLANDSSGDLDIYIVKNIQILDTYISLENKEYKKGVLGLER